MKPFAIELYELFRIGKTADDLSAELEIPRDRIEQRLRAAAAYLLTHRQAPDCRRQDAMRSREFAPVWPLAIDLYEKYRSGATPLQLSAELDIPVSCIELRLRAAACYVASRRRMPNWRC